MRLPSGAGLPQAHRRKVRSGGDGFFVRPRSGVVIRVLVQPRASAERVFRLYDGTVKAYVASAPKRGRANIRLIRLLADRLRVARRDIEIVSGTAGRRKLIRVAGLTQADVRQRILREQREERTPNSKAYRRRRAIARRRARRSTGADRDPPDASAASRVGAPGSDSSVRTR